MTASSLTRRSFVAALGLAGLAAAPAGAATRPPRILVATNEP